MYDFREKRKEGKGSAETTFWIISSDYQERIIVLF